MQMLAAPPAQAAETELFAWVAQQCNGAITRCAQTSGGNRCRSWAIDVTRADGCVAEVFLRYGPPRPPGVEPYTVHREAQIYRAIAGSDVQAPLLIAEHPHHQAILTSRAQGIAEFRRLTGVSEKQSIARELMDNLARLHRIPIAGVALEGGLAGGGRIADHVRAELNVWQAMYHESGQSDALLDLAFGWLHANMPDPDGPVVLAHGDAGPGNFLFQHGRLTALIDWELAHLGDPMEDLAWFSMRCVMEPVPDFPACLQDYARFSGAVPDRTRILYHRVFVSTRVVVIRHRNVTGEPAHAIVSRALNRRLLTEALAEASGYTIAQTPPLQVPQTPNAALYDHVLADLRDTVAARSTDSQVIATAKTIAKVIKYLKACDQYGDVVRAADQTALCDLLRARPTASAADQALTEAMAAGRITFAEALGYFASQAARQAQLAAEASGGIASRHYPAF